jgi:hypothetical protein
MRNGNYELKSSMKKAVSVILALIILTGCASSAPAADSEEAHTTPISHKRYEAFLRNRQVAYLSDISEDDSVIDCREYFNIKEAYTIAEIADAIGKKESINSIYTKDYNLYYKYIESDTTKKDELYVEISFPDPDHASSSYVMIFTERENKLEARYFGSTACFSFASAGGMEV